MWPRDFGKKHIEHMYLPRKTRIDGKKSRVEVGRAGIGKRERDGL